MYFDGTFRCVSHPFIQCLIVMIFADREDRYVPVAWILLMGKTIRCYMEVVSWVGCCLPTGCKPTASFVGVDFEEAFFTSVQMVFSDAFIVGCFFHFKQANRRRMKKLNMHGAVIDAILLALDYAPCLPMNEILWKGIPYLKFLVKKRLKDLRKSSKINKKTWGLYWKYFEE